MSASAFTFCRQAWINLFG